MLNIKNLNLGFHTEDGFLPIISDVYFSVKKGEILAIAGESGCGKSVTCLSLAKLLPKTAEYTSGEIYVNNKNVLSLSEKELRKTIRGKTIAYIFQEPMVSLNPVFKIGNQIAEVIHLHRPEVLDVETEIISLLKRVGIPDPESRKDAYPHQMSGGMQQRIMIAMALASNPDFLIADEPTTALDVTIQAQILDLLKEIQQKTNMGIILVTHDLGVIAEIADRVIIMYAGEIVETATAQKLFKNPAHPYTSALIKAVPELSQQTEKLTTIPGTVPSPGEYGAGCRFAGRCEYEQDSCSKTKQSLTKVSKNHYVKCCFPLSTLHS
ncbi:MAG: ABC transporter ATP-binding protein [Verrucomicrobiota bacterium]|nr:ABC transporter ATP-binding protein [Verrucomicrobiota bacterium]